MVQLPALQILPAGQPLAPLVQHPALEMQISPHRFWPPGHLTHVPGLKPPQPRLIETLLQVVLVHTLQVPSEQ